MSQKIYNIKVVVFGKSGVGKTTLLKKICHDRFDPISENTIMVDQFYKTHARNNNKQKINQWDTAGQERFNSMPMKQLKTCDICLFCQNSFSVESFNQIEKLIDDYQDEIVNRCALIVGLKSDKHSEQAAQSLIPESKVRKIAKYINAFHINVSSLNGNNIEEIQDYFLDYCDNLDEISKNVSSYYINKKKKNSYGGCCESSRTK